jgi:hypothetical protein
MFFSTVAMVTPVVLEYPFRGLGVKLERQWKG